MEMEPDGGKIQYFVLATCSSPLAPVLEDRVGVRGALSYTGHSQLSADTHPLSSPLGEMALQLGLQRF